MTTPNAEYVLIGWGHRDATGKWVFHDYEADHLGCVGIYIRHYPAHIDGSGAPDA